MEFLRNLSFSREGCFEPALQTVDLYFTLHEVFGAQCGPGETVVCSVLVKSATTLDGRRLYAFVSDSLLLKTLPLDATLVVQTWITAGPVSDVDTDPPRCSRHDRNLVFQGFHGITSSDVLRCRAS